MTFNFWYRLSEALFKEDNTDKTALFKPYIESLFEALCVYCRMEPDSARVRTFWGGVGGQGPWSAGTGPKQFLSSGFLGLKELSHC